MSPFAILMANWNKEAYIESAIESVLAQSDPDWILVIADDESSDGSIEKISQYRDRRIRLLQVPHSGPGATYRAAAQQAFADSGIWAAGALDSDDTLHPDALRAVRRAYASNHQVGCVYTQNYRCTGDRKELGRCRPIPAGETILSLHEREGILRVSHWYTFCRAAYLQTAGFQCQARHQDMDLVLRLEEVTKLLFVDEPLYNYRLLEDGLHTGRTVADFAPLVRARARARRAGQPEP